jgi:protocatechuate 3,4-dioxygenase beta subunit
MFTLLAFASGQTRKAPHPIVSDRAIKGNPDIAAGPQSEAYIVVWQERSGGVAGDRDVMARIIRRDGSSASGVIALASTGADERSPRVTAVGDGSWMVVWSTGQSIESCIVAATGQAGRFRTITPASPRPVDRPVIGADPGTGEVLIVWEELGEVGLSVIKARRLQVASGPENDVLVLGRSDQSDLRDPSINPAGSRFFVAWEKVVDARRIDIEGRSLAADATPAEGLGAVLTIAGDGARNGLPSVVDLPGTDSYFVVWQRQGADEDSDIAFADIVGAGVRNTGRLTNTPRIRESRPFASSAGVAGRVLVTYQTAPAEAPQRREITARTIGWGDNAASMEFMLDSARTGGGNPAAIRSAGSDGGGIVVWDVNEGMGTGLYAREWVASELPVAPPAVKIVSPVGGRDVSKTVLVQASVNAGSAIGRVEFLVDGVMVAADPDAPYAWSWDTVRSGNGVHSIAAVARDEFGQSGRDEIAVNVANAIVAQDDHTISGTVTVGVVGQGGVLLAGLPGAPRTNESGAYTAVVPAGWSGTVTPALPGFTFSPPSRTYTGLAADATGENYASTFAGVVDDVFEPNNAFASAAVIPLGTTQDLVLNDEEWFRVYVPAEDAGKDLKVRVWATSFPDGTTYSDPLIGKDLDFGVLDASGKLLTYALSGSADETAYICGAAEGWYYIVQDYVGIPGTVYAITAEASDAFGLSYVSGTVTADGGGGIDGASVELYWEGMEWNQPHPQVFTDSGGHYKIGWAPGSYTVRFNFQDFADNLAWTPDLNYVPELYRGGETVALGSGATVSGIDGELTPGGVVSGRVTDADGNPLNQAVVSIYTADSVRAATANTDVSGNYAFRRLRAANYAVRFRAPNGTSWANEWYDNRSSLTDSLPVPVAAGATTAGVDAALATGGFIHGHVTDPAGDPAPNVQVTALDPSGIALWSVSTNGLGEYVLGNLPPGSFKVFFNANNSEGGFLASEYYPDQRLIGNAVPVTVTLGQTTDGIDAQLAGAGIITGRVTDGVGNGIARVSVIAFDTASEFFMGVSPNNTGNFMLRCVPPGTYRILARPSFANGDKAPRWYADAATYAIADTVPVASGGTAADVNIVLDEGGGAVSGRVTDSLGAGIPGILVIAQDAAKMAVNYASITTDVDGYYTLVRVPAGPIKALFNADGPYQGYVSEYYNDKGDHASADTVTVDAGETTPATNAVLAARPALGITTTLLPNGEFAVPYSLPLALSGGRSFYHWAITSGALPEGLTMNAKGEITGTPTVEGTFPFTVQASDSSFPQQFATQGLSITVGAFSGSGLTISGTVTSGGSPLPGVVLSGLPGSPVTNTAGHYATVVDPAWSGTVAPVLAGHFFDPVNRTYTTVTGNLTGQDYTAEAGFTISGRVTYSGTNQANVRLSGLPGETRTDATGAYSAAVPAGWSGTVTPVVPGFTFTPADRTYSAMAANASSQDYASSYAGGVDDAYEDNDGFASAAALPLGTTPDLILRDADWFRVYVPAGGPGRVLMIRLKATAFPDGTCYTDPNVGKDLDFGVLDASGKMLTFNLSGSADETAYVPDVAEGWYYISQMYVGFAGAVYSVTAEVSDAYMLGYVSGTIRDEGGQGIEGVCVELYEEPFDWNVSRPLTATDASGHYKIAYTPGEYTVRLNITDFADTEDWTPEVNYIGKLYNYGEVIAITPATPLTDIDSVLSPGGTINGRVTDAAGDPLFQAQVRAYAGDMVQAAYAFTDTAGNYTLRRLRPANYAINFIPPGGNQLGREWFDDQRSFAAATPVAVQASVTTSAVNAALDTGGYISGHVTDMAGNPIQGVRVTALDASGLGQQSVTTNDSGDYVINRVTPGDLKVYFNASTSGAGNYVSEYYPDKRFIADAGLVPVSLGQTTAGIDAQLAAAGTISGRVTDDNGQAMPYAPAACFDMASELVVTATADIDGYYQVRNLPPGQYKVRLKASYGGWSLEWFDAQPTFGSGDTVTVAAGGTVPNINASLAALGGSIAGRVTNELGAGIAGVTVQAQDVSRAAGIYSGATDADGYYSIGRVPPGQAKVFFNADAAYLNYVSEYYSDKSGHGGADTVSVATGEMTPGINAVLATRPGLAVTTASLPGGTIASAYSAQLAGSGGRTFYRWTVTSGALPQGLWLSPKGEITGTPLTQGTFPFTVQVTDSTAPQQVATRELSITVAAYSGAGYLVSGTVTAGGSPLGGVVLNGFPGSPATSAAGTYVAVVPSGWTGTVTPVHAGYAFAPPTRTYANVSANMTGQGYAATPGFAISGTVTLDGGGQAAVILAGLPGDPTTDAAGAYSMTVPAGWSGTVTPTLFGFTFSPASRTYANMAGSSTAQDYTSTFVGGADDAYEENDSFGAAAIIPKGTIPDLVLNDEDWFRIYVPAEDAGKVLRVRIAGTSYPDQTSNRDLDFAILDATGRMLSYSLSGSPDETAYVLDISEGWYYIAHTYVGLPGTVYSLTADTNDDYGLAYVSGTVRDDGGQPIAGVCVELYGDPFNWNVSRPLVTTDSSGHYKIGYVPGSYRVEFNITDFNDSYDWTPDVNYIGEVYNDGQVLTLAAGTTTSAIDGQLTRGGSISGRITDASGDPLFQAVANVYLGDTARPAGVFTDANGNYVIDRLRTANYAVRMRAPGGSVLATEWYSDRPSFAAALPVPVIAGQTTGGINAALGAAGSISGRVTDAGGNPIGGVQVAVNDITGIALQTAMTDGSGNYFVGRLPAANLIVYFNATTANGVNFASEYYPDKLFVGEAQAVPVLAGQTTSGIDAELAGAGTITGRVTASGGTPLAGITVTAFGAADGALVFGTTTDTLGNYTIRNILPGGYKVRFRPDTGATAAKWWNDKGSFAAADQVTVEAGQTVASIDGELSTAGGSISGHVTDALGAPIAGLTVLAQDPAIPASLSSAVTNQNGDYVIDRLPAGPAKVHFNADPAFLNFISEYYNDQGTHGAATPVAVVAGEATTGINAMLAARLALTVTTTSLPAGQLAVAYDATLAGAGGRTLYHWSIESGALPDGLMMNGRGEIGGTPSLAGTFDFTVKLTDSTSPQQQTTKPLSITVGAFTGEGSTISGKILLGGQPLAGVIMNGLPGDPGTNLAGGYVRVVPVGWTGTATPVLAGYLFTPAHRDYSNITSSQSGQDYVAQAAHMISGTVTLNSTGLAGVTLSGLPGGPSTGVNGTYAVLVPEGWAGTVTPTLAGYAFAPASRTYSNVTAALMSENYTATVAPPFTAKVDFNKDGQEDILWRYYGEGGYIRAWFLGNSEPPGLWAPAAAIEMEAGRMSHASGGNGAAGRAIKSLREAGMEPAKRRSALRAPRNLMGGAKRPAGRAKVADPRIAGGKGLPPSPPAVLDPRQVRLAFSSGAASDSRTEPASAPTLQGGGDVMPVGDLNWQIVGTGDFDNDADVDILWRNASTGTNVVWFMNGTDWAGSAELLPVADLSWRIVGTGDFNKDTHVDILWRNSSSGENVVWYMSGTTWIGSAVLLGVSDQSWQIVGTGDFNKDGNIDILWRNNGAGGANVVWYMSNASWIGSAELIPVGDPAWQIMGTGDYNKDGNADILWRYNGAGGANYIWYMDHTTWIGGGELLPVGDLTWRIVSR